jgi:hypothetical protein
VNRVFLTKLAERVAKSFFGGFAAAAVFLHGGAFSADNLKIAVGAGVSSVIFGFIGKAVGDPSSPSWLPAGFGGAAGGAAGAAVGGAIGSTVGETVGGITSAVGDLAKDVGEATGLDKGSTKRKG